MVTDGFRDLQIDAFLLLERRILLSNGNHNGLTVLVFTWIYNYSRTPVTRTRITGNPPLTRTESQLP